MHWITILFLSLFCLELLVLLFFLISPYKKVSREVPTSWPKVSIMVAARNEEDNIRQCIESLIAIDYPQEQLQILLGNDHSEDRTFQIMKEYEVDERVNVYEIDQPNKDLWGKANVLEQLSKKATGDYLFVTDADCRISREWVKDHVSAYKNETGVVTGFSKIKGGSFIYDVQAKDWVYGIGMMKAVSDIGLPTSAMGNNMSFRKNAFEEIGGYTKIGFHITEDYHLFHHLVKAGWKWEHYFEPAAEVEIQAFSSFKKLSHQRKRWMKGASSLPIYMLVLLGVQGLSFYVLLGLIACDWKLGIGALMGRLLLKFLIVIKQQIKTGVKIRPLTVPVYLIWSDAFNALMMLFFIMPVKTVWKGRRY